MNKVCGKLRTGILTALLIGMALSLLPGVGAAYDISDMNADIKQGKQEAAQQKQPATPPVPPAPPAAPQAQPAAPQAQPAAPQSQPAPAAPAPSAPVPSGPKPRVAIQLFEDRSGSGAPGEAITDMMTTELISADLFVILEREKLGMVTGEQDLAAAGYGDVDTAPEYGKIQGAEFSLTGSITEWRTDTAGGVIPIPVLGGIAVGSHTATVMLDVRIVNNRTGEVIMAVRDTGSSNATVGGIATRYGGFGGGKTGGIFAGATYKVVLNIIEHIKTDGLAKMQAASGTNMAAEAARSSANILAADLKAGTATIDAGLNVNIRNGSLFAVYKVGNVIKDLSGNVLGEEKKYIAVLQVTNAQAAYSTCRILQGKGFARGDKVQRINDPSDVVLN